MEIKDHVFIVTGASSGIGLSTAIALSDRGAKVALLARSTDALKELAQKLPGSLPFTVDMTQFDRVREAVSAVHQHYGRVDGLVNNAGRSYAAAIEEIDPALFDEIFHLNVLGPIVAIQAVIPVCGPRGRQHCKHQFGDRVHDNSWAACTRLRSVRCLALVSPHAPSWKRTASSSAKSTHSSRRRTSARRGWAIQQAADPRLTYAEGDKPEFVAGLVLQAVEEGQAQYFANDRLRKMAGVAA